MTLFSDLPPQPVPELAVTLRPYQVEAVDATFAWMSQHSGHPLIVVPTGGGKSLIQTAIIHAVLREYPRDRILCLTHVRELIQQNHDATLRAWPGAPVGICSAGIGRREWDAQVLFAGIQTVYKKAAKLQWADVIVVDEAHLLPKEGEGMYRTLINAMLGMNPKLRIIGLTATPYRTDSGLLHKGKDALFTDIAYTCDLVKLIEDGYLSPIISKGTGHQIDTTAVQKRGGEFIAGQLQAAATRGDLVAQSVAEIVERGRDRKAWLLFACGIKHAEQIAEALRSHHVDCETIFGDTPDEQRDRIVTRYKAKKLRAIVNVGVLTTGFDAPHVDLIALLRPTCSPGLYVQMVGRGLRRAEGKTNCLARGTLVLTDRGEVPIEMVTKDMLLWDGIEFVRHGGSVCMGVQSVIQYAGLTATPDHMVWTTDGWKTLYQCEKNGRKILVGSVGGRAVREADGLERGGTVRKSPLLRDRVHVLPVHQAAQHGFSQEGDGWVSGLLKSTGCAEVAGSSLLRCEGSVHKSKKPCIPQLRWKGNPVRVQVSNGYGSLDHGELKCRSNKADRSNRQQQRLQTWEYPADDSKDQRLEQPKPKHHQDASVSPSLPTCSVCRPDDTPPLFDGAISQRDSNEVPEAFLQAEREVWDILNSGPRHRFVASGLIVSNCLVLDYGENVERHGPIDCVQPTDDNESEGDGTPPVKKCPQCASYVHAAISICPDCGFVFPPREITHKPIASNAPIISAQASRPTIERWDVRDVHYAEHRKPGKPVSLRVDYTGTGYHQRASEWVCFEHEGFARKKAEMWWQKRGGRMPAPPTVDLALVRIECGELPPVASIVLDTRGEYPEVKGCVLGKHEAGDESNVKSASLPDPSPEPLDYLDLPF